MHRRLGSVPGQPRVVAAEPTLPSNRRGRTAAVRVLKFGSSALGTCPRFDGPVEIVRRALDTHGRVIVVASALPGVTDRLGALVRAEKPAPPALVSSLLATGEQAAVSLLAIALARGGLDVGVLTSPPVRTSGPWLRGNPTGVRIALLRRAMARHAVVVIPGFVGLQSDGGTSLLGRGGSDLTAVLVSEALGCDCRLIKDVDGVYERDPAQDPKARRFRRLTLQRALGIDDRIIQKRAVEYALRRDLHFSVGAALEGGTVVGAAATQLYAGDARESAI